MLTSDCPLPHLEWVAYAGAAGVCPSEATVRTSAVKLVKLVVVGRSSEGRPSRLAREGMSAHDVPAWCFRQVHQWPDDQAAQHPPV
jgi:hypothetical protein